MKECNMDVFKLPVHPAADVFPMLDEDELVELSVDIAENGLQQPVVVGEHEGELVLVDGRNRREACARVNVEPEVRKLNGQDQVAFILSANINRRHLSKGQRAMVVARICSVSEQTQREAAQQAGVANGRVGQASTVIQFAPEKVDAILRGDEFLDKAYTEARQRKEAANSRESRFARLKESAPELADLVVEERMVLEEAEAAHREREQQRREHIKGTFQVLNNACSVAPSLDDTASPYHVLHLLPEHADVLSDQCGMTPVELVQCLRRLSKAASTFADELEAKLHE